MCQRAHAECVFYHVVWLVRCGFPMVLATLFRSEHNQFPLRFGKLHREKETRTHRIGGVCAMRAGNAIISCLMYG